MGEYVNSQPLTALLVAIGVVVTVLDVMLLSS